jgi:hypothetical protein
MGQSAAQRAKKYRERQRVTVERAAEVVARGQPDASPMTTALPVDPDMSLVRRALYSEVLRPTPPDRGGAVRVAAARALLADSDKRLERAMKVRSAEAPPLDFGENITDDDAVRQ